MSPDIKLERVNGGIQGVAGMATLKTNQAGFTEPLTVEVVVVAPDADSLAVALRRLGTRPVPGKNQVVSITKVKP